MASSLLALLDDVTTVMRDVAVITKVATKKTAGVLGDDLALNAQQVAGVTADRELPVVWAVAKGSVVNKLILVPSAVAISTLLPWAVTPLLMLGGAFLCFEGCEKVYHKLLHSRAEVEAREKEVMAAVLDTNVDMVAFEREKIKGAIRTDFILSAEIVVIALGSIADAGLLLKFSVLAAVAAIVTVGVYGFVAGLVKLDDIGVHLMESKSGPSYAAGRAIVAAAPWLMKALSVLGTAAMFLVGGGILAHGVPAAEHALEARFGASSPAVQGVVKTLFDAAVGVTAGSVLVGVVAAVRRAR
ncbi:MAG: DUF808 domain-containing protein [Elusimicrobia bacterium]|nr:DUF808 domain-containing protein [Elusimicrobiota bacterium]